MSILRWLVGGLLGGAAGVILWVLVGYFAHLEVGWIAWVVGFLTGVGVRYAAYLNNEDASFAKGALACIMAVGAIFLAKFLVFSLLTSGRGSEPVVHRAMPKRFDDEEMVAAMAGDLADEATERGEKIAWPPGASLDTAAQKSDFPPNIWKNAQDRWNRMGPKERQEATRVRMLLAMAVAEQSRRPDFGEFFTPWDLLWFGLAIVTAYKVGVGSYGSD